jgi:hypothetical protein
LVLVSRSQVSFESRGAPKIDGSTLERRASRVAFPKGGKQMNLKTLAAALAVGLLTAASVAQAQDKGTIGIAMPTKTSARWIADGDNMVKTLQAKGYKTGLQYADDDIPNQLAQVENMITKGDCPPSAPLRQWAVFA